MSFLAASGDMHLVDQVKVFQPVTQLCNALFSLDIYFLSSFCRLSLPVELQHAELAKGNLPVVVSFVFTSTLAVAIRLQLVQRPGVSRDAIIELLIEACLGSILGTQRVRN